MNNYTLHLGDNLATLKTYPNNYFDSIVTDPPYGIEFLGKEWDKDTGKLDLWKECLRVLKPGGYILAFSAARTYHQLASNIESAGFEIRDQLMWLYSSGFPKAQDIGKAIDKRAGKIDQNYGTTNNNGTSGGINLSFTEDHIGGSRRCIKCKKDVASQYSCKEDDCGMVYKPQTDEGTQWNGWKTALKPAFEPLVFARKSTGVERSLISNSVDETTHLMETLCILVKSAQNYSPATNTTNQNPQIETSTAPTLVEQSEDKHRCVETPAANMLDSLGQDKMLWNIVLLWNSISAALYQVENTFTTETAISITTRLATLRYSLLKSIQENTLKAHNNPNGAMLSARSAELSLQNCWSNLKHTLKELSVLAPVTHSIISSHLAAQDAESYSLLQSLIKENIVAADATTKTVPAHEPIVMARKPFKGSTIDNVLKNGLGAMNIDATRVPWADAADAEVYAEGTAGFGKYMVKDGGPEFEGVKKKKSDREIVQSWSNKEKGKATYKYFDEGTDNTKTDYDKVDTFNNGGRYPSNVIGEVEECYQKYFYKPSYNYQLKPGTDSTVINMIKEYLCKQNTSNS